MKAVPSNFEALDIFHLNGDEIQNLELVVDHLYFRGSKYFQILITIKRLSHYYFH